MQYAVCEHPIPVCRLDETYIFEINYLFSVEDTCQPGSSFMKEYESKNYCAEWDYLQYQYGEYVLNFRYLCQDTSTSGWSAPIFPINPIKEATLDQISYIYIQIYYWNDFSN